MSSTAQPIQNAPSGQSVTRGGQSRQKGRRERETFVVIGNGMVSHKLCAKLAAGSSRNHRMVIFGEETRPAYDRVHLTRFLEGHTPQQLQLASREWYQDNAIDLYLGDPVVSVDRAKRVVRSKDGREVGYDRLIFATGSRAFVPPIEGRDLPGVFVYRTLDDLEQIKSYSAKARRAAVLGGGLLGIEAAKALKDLGLETWVTERGTTLLARQLNPEAGDLLRTHVEKFGIHVCTQRETGRIEALGNDRLLELSTGECLRVQLVVIAAGIRPRDELAAQCGLEIAPRGGIRINDWLQTSDPDVYAVGECASHNGLCYGLAAPGYKMADVLADNLLGKRRRFSGSELSTRLKLSGIEVASLGGFQDEGESLSWREKNTYRELVLHRGRLVGATAIGEWSEGGRVQELIERQARVWSWQQKRFVQVGRIWRGKEALPVSRWPEAALICNCVGVRRGQLSVACASGCGTVEQLAERTGASTVCGSCKPLLAEFLGAPELLTPVAGLKWLAVACVMAAVLALTIVLMAPVPFAGSVQAGLRRLDVLWRESFWKQVSGFSLLAVALLSLVFSLRKRIKRFGWGDFGHWRALHAVLGTVTLIALVSHTGFRLGHNFNFVLMANFLVLALVGSLAGGVTAWERRLSPVAGKRLRAFWTGTHIALAWPLPVLVAVHVMMAYYF